MVAMGTTISLTITPGFSKLKAQADKYQAYLLLMSLMSNLLNPELFILLFLCNKKDKTGLP